MGAHHVVRPEHDMGERVADVVRGRALDDLEVEEDFVLAQTAPPREAVGRTLGEAGLRRRYDVTVVGVEAPGPSSTYATPETRAGRRRGPARGRAPGAVRYFVDTR